MFSECFSEQMSKRMMKIRLYFSSTCQSLNWVQRMNSTVKKITDFLSVSSTSVFPYVSVAREGRQDTLLNLTHSVLLINWSSEKSYKADSGEKREMLFLSKILYLLASPSTHEICIFESTLQCSLTAFNYFLCVHSFRTKKRDR